MVHEGTPLDEIYRANAGGSIDTEAWQVLTSPVDFRACARILLDISSGEKFPSSASLRLVTGGRELDLGNEIFGLDPATKETLTFNVPLSSQPIMVSALRIVFRRNSMQQDESTRVAIDRFTLAPVSR